MEVAKYWKEMIAAKGSMRRKPLQLISDICYTASGGKRIHQLLAEDQQDLQLSLLLLEPERITPINQHTLCCYLMTYDQILLHIDLARVKLPSPLL